MGTIHSTSHTAPDTQHQLQSNSHAAPTIKHWPNSKSQSAPATQHQLHSKLLMSRLPNPLLKSLPSKPVKLPETPHEIRRKCEGGLRRTEEGRSERVRRGMPEPIPVPTRPCPHPRFKLPKPPTKLLRTEHPDLVLPVNMSGACSFDDRTAVWALGGGNDDGSLPKICSNCAHSALNVFTGIHQQKFNKCLTEQVSISAKCSTCFADAAQYAYGHCKIPCLQSEWSESCLKCFSGFDIEGCTGFDVPHVPLPAGLAAHIFPTVMKMCAVVLIGLFAGSGVSFALLRFGHSASGSHPWPVE